MKAQTLAVILFTAISAVSAVPASFNERNVAAEMQGKYGHTAWGKNAKYKTSEDDFVALTTKSGKLNESEVEAVYNRLPPVSLDAMIGEWKGGSFDTGHPTHASLKNIEWLGKTFHSTEDVDPVMIRKDGKRVLNEQAGHAVLRRIEYRGILSAAMIYDIYPIIDHFRYVNDHMVAGAMENKLLDVKTYGTYYFYLYK